jgi:hypothetical protein
MPTVTLMAGGIDKQIYLPYPATVLAIEKFVGNVTSPVNLAGTYTNKYAAAANKLEGFPS